jgi:hypothetical protein
MGGYGSGHHGERSNTLYVDDCSVLRVWDLQRAGFLRAGETHLGSFRLSSGRAVFLEVYTSSGPDGRLVADGQQIQLATSPGTLGGLRWWFICPESNRRVAALYRHPRVGRFLGREPMRLRYRSAYQDRYEVAALATKKAIRRLAGHDYSGPLAGDPDFIPRSPRQRWTTYYQNQARAWQAIVRSDRAFAASVARIVPGLLSEGEIGAPQPVSGRKTSTAANRDFRKLSWRGDRSA